mmetsp:Transcript_58172/g.142232  ORF Transcript_58172/g.142232 Transcript_58172/m.142232 type:complete len:505 (+) Transcript_58172:264-1778(+)
MSSSQNEAPPPNVINFACGHPDARLLPVQQIADATQNALLPPGRQGGDGDGDNYADGRPWLQYGRENGNYEARKSIAEFISTQIYGWKKCDSDNQSNEESAERVDPDMICLTSGVSHGIQLVARTLIRLHNKNNNNAVVGQSSSSPHQPKPTCFVEDPTYFLVPPILQQSGYDVQPVRTDPTNGLDLTALEQQFELARRREQRDDNSNNNKNPQNRLLVLYCIPTHHNPLGVSLSYESRTSLVELCKKYNVYLIADEVYLGLSWGVQNEDDDEAKPSTGTATITAKTASTDDASSSHIVPMLEVSMGSCPSSQQLVISVSAFTKILCPGIRCGWIHTQNQQLLQGIRQEGVLDSGGCTSQLSSGIIRQLILGGQLSTYLTELKTEYSQRCQHLCDALQNVSDGDQYPFKFRFEIPTGGYFLWVFVDGNIPFELDDPNFRLYCSTEHNVDFKTGTSCSSSSQDQQEEHQQPFASCIRLCFAYYDSETLEQGVQRLCRAIHEYSNR